MNNQISRTLLFVGTLLISGFSYAQYAGVSAQCYDGTELSLSLNTDSCLTSTGLEYLREKARNLCATNCSPVSGKCGTNSYRAEVGQCSSKIIPLYKGFVAQCHDGSRVELNTCSTPEYFVKAAHLKCEGRKNKLTGKVGLNSYSLKARCN